MKVKVKGTKHIVEFPDGTSEEVIKKALAVFSLKEEKPVESPVVSKTPPVDTKVPTKVEKSTERETTANTKLLSKLISVIGLSNDASAKTLGDVVEIFQANNKDSQASSRESQALIKKVVTLQEQLALILSGEHEDWIATVEERDMFSLITKVRFKRINDTETLIH